MATRVSRKSLTEQEENAIVTLLNLTPNPSYYGDFSPPPPLVLYKVDPITNEVVLPYAFAYRLTGQIPNAGKPDHPFQFTGSLYEEQLPVAETNYQQLLTHGTTICNLPTGSGKTVYGAYLAAKLKKITLIVFTQGILEKQWAGTFRDFTDATIWATSMAPAKPKKEAELLTEKLEQLSIKEVPLTDIPQVILTTNLSIDKVPPEWLSKVGTLIIDEAHQFGTQSRIDALMKIYPRYVIAATATFKRGDGMEQAIQTICGVEGVTKISTKPFQVVKYHTGVVVPLKHNIRGQLDWISLLTDLCRHEYRNKLICDIVKHYKDAKILIMSRRKEHVQILEKTLIQDGEKVSSMYGTKKNYNDARVLIGTVSKIGTGFDEKALCNDFNGHRIDLLILTCSIKSLELLEQVVGRAFRSKKPTVIHLIDNNNISKSHWKGALRWYKSRQGEITEYYAPPSQAILKVESKKVDFFQYALSHSSS